MAVCKLAANQVAVNRERAVKHETSQKEKNALTEIEKFFSQKFYIELYS